MVAKKKRKVKTSVPVATEDTAVQQSVVVQQSSKMPAEKSSARPTFAAVPTLSAVLFVVVVVLKRVRSGSWFAWSVQSWDQSGNRRGALQDETQLGNVNMLTCEACGYTIFPAPGRTNRFLKFTNNCPSCGKAGTFYDRNDPTDSRNIDPETGKNKAEVQREYMKDWIRADGDQAKKITKSYKEATNMMIKKGTLPSFLEKEIAAKKVEIAEDRAAGIENSASELADVGSSSEPSNGVMNDASAGDDDLQDDASVVPITVPTLDSEDLATSDEGADELDDLLS